MSRRTTKPWRPGAAAVTTALLLGPLAGTPPLATASAEPEVSSRKAAARSEASPAAGTAEAISGASGGEADVAIMSRFLDRLMMAESGGRDTAANPRSTAVGPFQFIESTFLDLARRHMAEKVERLTAPQILALRVNRAVARRAAEAYTRENAGALAGAGLPATFPNLRLAFLLGPGGAIRILQSAPATPAIRVLGSGVVQANPFMAGMTSADLIAWSHRNLAASDLRDQTVEAPAGTPKPDAKPRPAIKVACNRALASCRRWVSLASARANRKIATGASKRHAHR